MLVLCYTVENLIVDYHICTELLNFPKKKGSGLRAPLPYSDLKRKSWGWLSVYHTGIIKLSYRYWKYSTAELLKSSMLLLASCLLPVVLNVTCTPVLMPRSALLSLVFPKIGAMLPEGMFVSPSLSLPATHSYLLHPTHPPSLPANILT